MGGRKKRFWSDEEKRSICAQTLTPGVSVAQVARRYAMNANMVFKWLRDPRFAPPVIEEEPVSVFLPVEVTPNEVPPPTEFEPVPEAVPAAVGRIEIELAGGHRITTDGDVDPDVLARLLKGILS